MSEKFSDCAREKQRQSGNVIVSEKVWDCSRENERLWQCGSRKVLSCGESDKTRAFESVVVVDRFYIALFSAVEQT